VNADELTPREEAVWDAAFAAAFVTCAAEKAARFRGNIDQKAEEWGPTLGAEAHTIANAALAAYRAEVKP